MLLEGVVVLDLGSYISGPYCAMMLGDMGAEVIMIELPVKGTPYRSGEPAPCGESTIFLKYNRNKKSIAINLKAEEGRQLFYKLVGRADVMVENFRPGTAEELGIGYGQVSKIKPQIIYCSITGFGDSGPYRDRPAYDSMGMGLSGFLSTLIDPDSPRIVGPGIIVDQLASLYAVYGILSALYSREKTGRGEHVKTSLLEATLAFLDLLAMRYMLEGVELDIQSSQAGRQAYAAKAQDGKALLIHLSPVGRFWHNLVKVPGFEKLAVPELIDFKERKSKYPLILKKIKRIISTKPRDYWLAKLTEFDVPCAPLNSIQEALKDPQVGHLGLITEYCHPLAGKIKTIRNPIRLSGAQAAIRSAPPRLGQHTIKLLTDLGYTQGEIDELRRKKVI